MPHAADIVEYDTNDIDVRVKVLISIDKCSCRACDASGVDNEDHRTFQHLCYLCGTSHITNAFQSLKKPSDTFDNSDLGLAIHFTCMCEDIKDTFLSHEVSIKVTCSPSCYFRMVARVDIIKGHLERLYIISSGLKSCQ